MSPSSRGISLLSDTLVFKLRLLTEVRRGVANMRGLAFVGEKLVCEAEFMAQVVKNK